MAGSKSNLPAELSSFVGRAREVEELRRVIAGARLLTLTGSGGAGKTRLARRLTALSLDRYRDGACWVELAGLSDPELVATSVARALGLHDEPFRKITETIQRRLDDRQLLLVLDNCEHLAASCGDLIIGLLRTCRLVSVLATSREPLGVDGEVRWRVPSLAVPRADVAIDVDSLQSVESVALFVDRGSRARPGFALTNANASAVVEICTRLDGIPLALELAAARLAVLSPAQIAASLDRRLEVLTAGSRTAHARHRTLRASIEWSYELLSLEERALFVRLGVFAGDFDLAAVEAIGPDDGPEQSGVLDHLAALVDKSLVLADERDGTVRYRLLETVRQYAVAQLNATGDAHRICDRHASYYLSVAEQCACQAEAGEQDGAIDRLTTELDNLRGAFQWTRETNDAESAVRLATALLALWLYRGFYSEGRLWFDSALSLAANVGSATRVRAMIALALVEITAFGSRGAGLADDAVRIARELDDPVLSASALTAVAYSKAFLGEAGLAACEEAVEAARLTTDPAVLAHALNALAVSMWFAGNPIGGRPHAEEGYAIATSIGHRYLARMHTLALGAAMLAQGDLAEARVLLEGVAAEAASVGDLLPQIMALGFVAHALTMLGDLDGAQRAADASRLAAKDSGIVVYESVAHTSQGWIALARGDGRQARDEFRLGLEHTALLGPSVGALVGLTIAETALGALADARTHAEEAIMRTSSPRACQDHGTALYAMAYVEAAEGHVHDAQAFAHRALAVLHDTGDHATAVDALELIAALGAAHDRPTDATRLFGAAEAQRLSVGYVRSPVQERLYQDAILTAQTAIGSQEFAKTFEEGRQLTIDEAVAYANRGRGKRQRPVSGWRSLTPSELEVAELVGAGLANKDIAQRLFISPRTVQTHLTNIFRKLDVNSRTQVAAEVHRSR